MKPTDMTNKQDHIEDLRYVYRECVESDDEIGDAPGIADTFNRVVEELKKERSDDFLDSVNTIETSRGMRRAMNLNTGTVGKMKNESRKIIQKLGGEVPDMADTAESPYVDVNLDLDQTQSLENVIDIDLDAVIENIDEDSVRESAEEFRDELDKGEEADEDYLRERYNRVLEYSRPVAANLVASAIMKGVDFIV